MIDFKYDRILGLVSWSFTKKKASTPTPDIYKRNSRPRLPLANKGNFKSKRNREFKSKEE